MINVQSAPIRIIVNGGRGPAASVGSTLTALGIPTYANLAAAVAALGFGEVYYDTSLVKITTTARAVPSYINLAAANFALGEIGVPYFDTTLDELKTTTDIS